MTEVARLKRELTRVTEERDIFKKRPGTLPRNRREVPVHAGPSARVSRDSDVAGAPGQSERVLCVAAPCDESPGAGQPGAHETDAGAALADAGGLRDTQDVAASETRRQGLWATPSGATAAIGWYRRVAPTAVYPHRAGSPTRDANDPESPRPGKKEYLPKQDNSAMPENVPEGASLFFFALTQEDAASRSLPLVSGNWKAPQLVPARPI